MSGGSLIDYAWALVALDLVREFEADFVAAMSETFNRTGAFQMVPTSRNQKKGICLLLAYGVSVRS